MTFTPKSRGKFQRFDRIYAGSSARVGRSKGDALLFAARQAEDAAAAPHLQNAGKAGIIVIIAHAALRNVRGYD